MFAKRIDEIEDLDCHERKLLGLKSSGKNYVTFRKGHMQVDVGSFIRSRSGKDSVKNVIRHSPRKAESDQDPTAF
jgi:hypothetical protein